MRYYRRFSRTERIMHAFLMLSFVGCALTGLPLLFAGQPWASTLARILLRLLPPSLKLCGLPLFMRKVYLVATTKRSRSARTGRPCRA